MNKRYKNIKMKKKLVLKEIKIKNSFSINIWLLFNCVYYIQSLFFKNEKLNMYNI